MIDFHSHILPHMDDGSRDTAMTMRMLQSEISQGVDTIVSTSHFYAEENRIDRFLDKRQAMLEHVLEQMSPGMPTIHAGAEVCYFSGISEAGDIEKLAIEGTRVMLLEMPFDQWTRSVYEDTRSLIEQRDLTIVLAHLERFPKYQKDKSIYNAVLDLPVYVQCNAGPLLKMLKRGEVLGLFKSGTASLLGSDCHNDHTRNPNIGSGREVLRQKLGQQILTTIDTTGSQLLEAATAYRP